MREYDNTVDTCCLPQSTGGRCLMITVTEAIKVRSLFELPVELCQ
ncbi:hypothetical protein [Nostoc sp. GT001]|nr:hypothetical protein [Nostoc sp. GT001]MDM9584552.1 hypothetical protein [Nostoc sp. GT001]